MRSGPKMMPIRVLSSCSALWAAFFAAPWSMVQAADLDGAEIQTGLANSQTEILLAQNAPAGSIAHWLSATPPTVQPPATITTVPAPATAESLLSWYGITLYGDVDIGGTYQSHGTPLSDHFGPGLEYLIQKNSNHSNFSVAPNALSYTTLGLKGVEQLIPGLSVVFNLQTTLVPTSGALSDGPKSMIQNDGVPLNKQSTNADSSRAGQVFNSEAFGGLTSPQFGTLTFGRVNALTLDGVIAYDPQTASNAFSVIGWSGIAAGMGDTEDARLDDSLKYQVKIGPIRLAALYQTPGENRESRTAYEFGLGGDYAGISVDAIYSQIYGAVSASALSTEQVLTARPESLAATISDNTSVMLLARYVIGPVTADFGFENIQFDNPSEPLFPGAKTVGGYTLGVVSNTAYIRNRQFQVFWTGGTYHVTKKFKVSVAYYHEDQNSYKGNGCTNSSAGSCSGQLDAVSLVGDYQITRLFDIYAGAMYSKVANGLDSGYIHNNTIDPTIGARIKF